jgi:hypothetical protein
MIVKSRGFVWVWVWVWAFRSGTALDELCSNFLTASRSELCMCWSLLFSTPDAMYMLMTANNCPCSLNLAYNKISSSHTF